ncbi:LamG-like jellyroll fold domain-containing protein [Aquirufa lenticrescens]
MKKILTVLLILFSAKNLQAQFALASYQALNSKVYNAVDGSMEFSPTFTSGTPTNNQYLSIPASSNYEFTGDFTVECWVNFKNVSGKFQSFLGQYIGGGAPWIIQMQDNGVLRVVGNFSNEGYVEIYSSTLSANTWYHIALVRSGTSVKIYVNGVNNGSATITSSIGSPLATYTIGGGSGGNDRFNGFISNVRFVKGTALYTSNFTPPTSRLTAIAGTTLLLNTTYDAKYLKDNSSNGATVTNYNDISTNTGLATSSPLNPFKFVSDGLVVNLDATDASSYPGTGTTWTNLGTGGTTYNATLTNAPAYESGNTANLYFNKPTTGAVQQYGTININTGVTNAWTMEVIALVPNNGIWVQGTPFIQIADIAAGNNGLGAYIGVQGGVWNFYAGGNSQGAAIVNNTWKMITVVKSGTYQYIYVNGVVGEVKATVSNSLNEIKPLYLGNPPTNPAGTSVQQIKISRFKYYTRALSVSEIGINFSVQKAKYGL